MHKYLYLFGLVVMTNYSCNIRQKKLLRVVDKTLYSGHTHVHSGIRLTLLKDSTFEYSEGGPAVKYAKGKWRVTENKKEIILQSNKLGTYDSKGRAIDTVYISLNQLKVAVLSRGRVRIGSTILY